MNQNKSIKESTPPLFLSFLYSFLMLSLMSCSHSEPESSFASIVRDNKSSPLSSNSDFMQINIRNAIVLNSKKYNQLPITELSGIAWDQDEGLLYAVSDEGILYHLLLSFSEGTSNPRLTAMGVVFAERLRDKNGQPLKGKYQDSEGLTLNNEKNGIKGDSQLIISFENKPRIAKYTPTGRFIGEINIPKKLTKRKTYRSKNKALESVTFHPKYGILTAAEYPVKKDNIKYQTLYATPKGGTAKYWHFKASDAENSAITGLETLQDGSVLVLERAYKDPFTPIVISLRRLRLENCNKNRECKTEVIARFDGADGWLLDNYEGLAHLKGNQYLMISDDNDHPLQNTILIHFAVKK